jgi:quercetin dioxygenase-like cupin family protein
MPIQPDKPSPERVAKSPLPDKPPAAPAEVIDLKTEASQLREERPFQEHGQAAKTLVKHEHFRVVLIALKAGRRCREHEVEESVSVQTVAGRVRANLASDGPIDLPEGRVLALEPERAHDFEALEDSTLLLTLAWTGHRDERRTH